MQDLVQMRLADSGRSRSSGEIVSFIEQFVFPTLDLCERLEREEKILAGRPLGGAIALAVVIKAESIEELDELIKSLPVWPLMETTVTPLTSFDGREVVVQQILERQVRLPNTERT